MLFFGAFIMRYRIELILVFPLVALLMATYFRLAFRPNSAAQNPEELYREPLPMIEATLISVSMIALLYFYIPILGRFFRLPCLLSSGVDSLLFGELRRV
jgi:hypothetical protein